MNDHTIAVFVPPETGAQSWLGWNLLRSIDYADYGYRLAVPRQERPWCSFAAQLPAWLDSVPAGYCYFRYQGGCIEAPVRETGRAKAQSTFRTDKEEFP